MNTILYIYNRRKRDANSKIIYNSINPNRHTWKHKCLIGIRISIKVIHKLLIHYRLNHFNLKVTVPKSLNCYKNIEHKQQIRHCLRIFSLMFYEYANAYNYNYLMYEELNFQMIEERFVEFLTGCLKNNNNNSKSYVCIISFVTKS